MKHFFLSSLTKAMNAYLNLDTESQDRLKKLKGRTLTIELLPWHLVLHCTFGEDGLIIHDKSPQEAETTIRGTPLQLLGVMRAKEERQRFFAEDVVIEGNAVLGQDVISLFDDLHIDWEEGLSRMVGDVSAHHIGLAVSGIGKWFSDTKTRIAQDTSDYLHEEIKWLPTREALQDFFQEIDELSMAADRLEAKINKESQ